MVGSMAASEAVKNMKPYHYAILGVVVVGVGLVGYFGVYRPIMQRLGLIDDPEDRKALRMLNRAKDSKYWNGTYYKGRENKISLNPMASKSSEIAKELEKGIAGWGTNESGILSALGKLKTREDLSYVIWQYGNLFNKDLLNDIGGDMKGQELIDVLTITENLK